MKKAIIAVFTAIMMIVTVFASITYADIDGKMDAEADENKEKSISTDLMHERTLNDTARKNARGSHFDENDIPAANLENPNRLLSMSLDGAVDISTDKSEYKRGEIVTIITTNIGETKIEIAGPCFNISNEKGEVVLSVCLYCLWELEPGEYETLGWTQKDKNGRQVPLGNYTVEGVFTIDNENVTDNASFVIKDDNNPPDPPVITGPSAGKIWKMYTYNVTVSDPDGSNLTELEVDFDDGISIMIISQWQSGENISVRHMWRGCGSYTIKARVRDVYGAWSDWGTLEVSMPKSKQSTNLLFLQFL